MRVAKLKVSLAFLFLRSRCSTKRPAHSCLGHQGRRAIHTRYLRHGKGLRYPRSTLSRVAKPWELAMAYEFEEDFALIRGLLHSIPHVRKVLC